MFLAESNGITQVAEGAAELSLAGETATAQRYHDFGKGIEPRPRLKGVALDVGVDDAGCDTHGDFQWVAPAVIHIGIVGPIECEAVLTPEGGID